MIELNKNMLRGFGCILDIMPERREKSIFRARLEKIDKSVEERAWSQVGENIREAMEEHSDGKAKV